MQNIAIPMHKTTQGEAVHKVSMPHMRVVISVEVTISLEVGHVQGTAGLWQHRLKSKLSENIGPKADALRVARVRDDSSLGRHLMDPLKLKQKPVQEQLEVLSVRLDLLSRMWPEERHTRTLVAGAMESMQQHPETDPRHRMASKFLCHIFRLVRRPADVVHLCLGVPSGLQAQFVDRLVLSPATDGDLIAELVADPATFTLLPAGSWVEYALTRYVRILLEDHPGRRFEIEELIPFGIEKEPFTARALLGAAFDEGRLTDQSVNRLLELFPKDTYLTDAILKQRTNKPEA
jgi:hypothetical protein